MIEVPGYFASEVLQDNGFAYEAMIAMEEMGELTKELSKHLRGIGDVRNIAEEIGDCYICLKNLQTGLFISDREINESIKEKCNRYLNGRRGDTI